MKSNCPEAGYSKVSAIHLSENRQFPSLLPIKPGSLKVKGGMVTFTAIILESDVALLYVPPSERLANR